jgi:hypothetical protein
MYLCIFVTWKNVCCRISWDAVSQGAKIPVKQQKHGSPLTRLHWTFVKDNLRAT